MKLPISLARILLLLTEQESISYSQFSDKKLLEKLIEDGVLIIISPSRTKKLVRLKSIDYLNNYLHNTYNISDLYTYIEILSNKDSERADLAIASGNSKIKSGNVFSGFLINAYEEIYGQLNHQEISLKPTQGSFIFINDCNNFKIPEDITVVVIENFENFKYIESQKYLFPSEQKKLFAWRYQNNALSEWLCTLPNDYIHFGDFDLPGLNIYLNFRKKRTTPNSKFLIPENIKNLIEEHGNRDRYLAQFDYTKNIDFSEFPEISELAFIINSLQKSLEQEVFIRRYT